MSDAQSENAATIVTACRRQRGLSPPALHPHLALGECAGAARHADERVDDLQRPPPALLGTIRRQPGCALAADRQRRRARLSQGRRADARYHRRPRPLAGPERTHAAARVPLLGDDSLQLQSRSVAPLAPDVRLVLRRRHPALPGVERGQRASETRSRAPPGGAHAAPPLRRGQAPRDAELPQGRGGDATTTPCRSSPMSRCSSC